MGGKKKKTCRIRTSNLNLKSPHMEAKREKAEERICLKCDKEFTSDGNRVCPKCTYENEHISNRPHHSYKPYNKARLVRE